MLKRIHFWATVLGGDVERVYQLGIGPCGKEVVHLACVEEFGWLHISQTHKDNTRKEFSYPAHMIKSKVTKEFH
ncbi:hypothetical protein AXI70_gp06 [Cronobacter phage Dev-CD-23823]|uniref:Uncharacterized protein n=1 Tax=Cronobacter phage Dev-CD-23823 TaxID=1712539 RepID=A0A0K8IXM0_9CAUD|nr:hypothetical protein AXI70_gp06 [Cronobacter phage Dev-CD-23823]CUH74581.1 hypothetical protein [Cronobacter phage Dev-CD-23823]